MKLRDISPLTEPRIDMHDAELNPCARWAWCLKHHPAGWASSGIGKSTLTLQTILHMPSAASSM